RWDVGIGQFPAHRRRQFGGGPAMPRGNQALVREFIRLRHGWGLADADLHKRLGPNLMALCGIRPDDTDRAARHKILTTVRRLTSEFALADQLAVELALGGSPGTQHRRLAERVAIIAERLALSERTARRHIDRAFALLAEEAAAADRPDAVGLTADPERGWRRRRL